MVSFLFLILVALFVVGVMGAFIVLAFASGRNSGRVAGGLALVGLLVGAAALFGFVGLSAVRMSPPRFAVQSETMQASINSEDGTMLSPSVSVRTGLAKWSFFLSSAVFVVLGVGALVAFALRHRFGHTATAGHKPAWPFVLGLVLLGLFAVRWIQPARIYVRAESNRTIGTERHGTAERLAVSDVPQSIPAQVSDIQELMDAFDAPRIAVQGSRSQPPPPSSAELVALASVTEDDAESKNASVKSDPALSAEDSGKSQSQPRQPGRKQPHTETAETANDGSTSKSAEAAQPAALNATKLAETTAAASSKTIATAHPAWVDSSPVRTRDLRREVIVTEEYQTTDECFRAADVYLMLKAYERLQQLLGRPNPTQILPSITFQDNNLCADGQIAYGHNAPTGWREARLSLIDAMGLTPEYLRNAIVSKDAKTDELHEYFETSTRSFGPMKRLHTQIEFTPKFDDELLRRWDARRREDRFAYVGLGAGSVLGVLGMAWGLLRLDTATKGYYSKWLFIGVPAAIIGVSLVSMLAFI